MESSKYVIPVNGLTSLGSKFEWVVDKEFFANFGNTEIIDAQLVVLSEAVKSARCIRIDCQVNGPLTVVCDRCLADLVVPVDLPIRLSLRYEGAEYEADEEDDREVIYMPPADTEFDMEQIIYDYICLSLPIQRIHPDGGCDPEVAGRLGINSQILDGAEHISGDNPFAALKGLFDN